MTWVRYRWVAAGLTSLLFASLHGLFDPLSMAYFVYFALVACWLTFRTGGLEAAIVLHTTLNVLIMLIAGTQGVPDVWAEQPPATPLLLVTDVVATTLFAVWVHRAWTRRELRDRQRRLPGAPA
ncbi:CAAX prenyl protease-like protein [Kineococcus xinjiangensis]|uniref:CAAX prenyl protease-like protein n=1 Tax=Kineococcus xinjiangensis TaxID=512762 RepID=A0A2S6IMD6_9ACTN|nr:CAAX prenyl protease-like protein [Kineococcus xinjiangensis]